MVPVGNLAGEWSCNKSEQTYAYISCHVYYTYTCSNQEKQRNKQILLPSIFFHSANP